MLMGFVEKGFDKRPVGHKSGFAFHSRKKSCRRSHWVAVVQDGAERYTAEVKHQLSLSFATMDFPLLLVGAVEGSLCLFNR